MIRISLIIFGVCMAVSAAQARTAKESEQKRSKKIDYERFLAMDDPVKASKLLLQRADSLGVRMDMKGHTSNSSPVGLPSGPFKPQHDGTEFIERAKKHLHDNAESHTDTVCVFQLSRQISIRELSAILSASVRIYAKIGGWAYIARVPIASLDTIAGFEFVGWIDAYRSEYKFKSFWNSDTNVRCCVVPLVPLEPGFGEELETLGAKQVRVTYTRNYDVWLTPPQIRDISQLWWVREIYKAPVVSTH